MTSHAPQPLGPTHRSPDPVFDPQDTAIAVRSPRVPMRVGAIDTSPAVLLGLAVAVNSEPDMHLSATAGSVRDMMRQGDSVDVLIYAEAAATTNLPTEDLFDAVALAPHVVLYASGSDSSELRNHPAVSDVVLVREPLQRLIATLRRFANEDSLSLGSASRLAVRGSVVPLTAREQEVLRMYAAGATAEEVADRLFITRQTVHDHVRRIRAKYRAAGRPAATKVDLFRRAVEDGYARGA